MAVVTAASKSRAVGHVEMSAWTARNHLVYLQREIDHIIQTSVHMTGCDNIILLCRPGI